MSHRFAAIISAFMLLAPAAGAQTRFFVAAGPTGTSDLGFRGGFGGTLGFEHRIAKAAAIVTRLDGAGVPMSERPIYGMPSILSLGESGALSSNATILSLVMGLRLGGSAPLAPYLDALVGVGYMNDPASTPDYSPAVRLGQSSTTDIALSFGPGIAMRAPHMPAVFADVHYDFYFSRGAATPVIPVRVGVLFP